MQLFTITIICTCISHQQTSVRDFNHPFHPNLDEFPTWDNLWKIPANPLADTGTKYSYTDSYNPKALSSRTEFPCPTYQIEKK